MTENLSLLGYTTHQRVIACRLSAGLNGVNPHEALSVQPAGDSLYCFAERLTNSGKLAELISYESTTEVKPDDFYLVGGSNRNHPPIHPEQRFFYHDAPYSMILAQKQTNTSWCCGIDQYSKKSKFYSHRGIDTDAIEPGSIIIVQLQGKTYDRQGENVVKGLRWEYVLVQCVAIWAQSMFHGKIYIQPGENNEYFRRNSQAHEAQNLRLLKRYDETARQLGFKVNGPGRLHSLNLQWFDPAFRVVK